jgi:hypothetical protein
MSESLTTVGIVARTATDYRTTPPQSPEMTLTLPFAHVDDAGSSHLPLHVKLLARARRRWQVAQERDDSKRCLGMQSQISSPRSSDELVPSALESKAQSGLGLRADRKQSLVQWL